MNNLRFAVLGLIMGVILVSVPARSSSHGVGVPEALLGQIRGQNTGGHLVSDNCVNYIANPPVNSVTNCSGQPKGTDCYTCPNGDYNTNAPGGTTTSMSTNTQVACNAITSQEGSCPGNNGACGNLVAGPACQTNNKQTAIYQNQPVPVQPGSP